MRIKNIKKIQSILCIFTTSYSCCNILYLLYRGCVEGGVKRKVTLVTVTLRDEIYPVYSQIFMDIMDGGNIQISNPSTFLYRPLFFQV
jgi:hypothetical protein